ncbi:HNH endonuclease [Klebsiella phage Muenster]|nr:HNH endonuclease [Klebsiella phage Muenster]
MGRKQTEETRKKISNALKAKNTVLPEKEIIEKYTNGIAVYKLAKEYKCHKTRINSIIEASGVKRPIATNKNRFCEIHKCNYEKNPQGKWKCNKCDIQRVSDRRRELKLLAVEYKGGCCEKCGYDKCIAALEFHHLDPNEKDFGISSSGHTRSFEKLKIELDKCIMVCANCHREIHDDERKE